jgi:hypothetical protein
MYVDPNTVKDGKDFLAKVHDLKQATVSSSKVDEDAYGGVMAALDKVDWTQFGARYVVLITDAGALDGTDNSLQPIWVRSRCARKRPTVEWRCTPCT